MADDLSELFQDSELGHASLAGAASPEDLFALLENLKDVDELPPVIKLASQTSTSASVRALVVDDAEEEGSVARKKLKFSVEAGGFAGQDGLNRISHISVERNRRKQMNDHLSVLRSLMPCFYVKRGDQASIIGGVVEYIKELQQVLQSLEAKKQRKFYNEVLSPRPVSSPRPSPLSPRPPPLSPRMNLPISPRTPQPGSPYNPTIQYACLNPTMVPSLESSPSMENSTELATNSKSSVADVEVKFSGPNVLLKTVSHRIPGQALKIITALEGLALEILQVNISTIDDTMLNSFTIKIGIECELSAEELAQEIQQTFS